MQFSTSISEVIRTKINSKGIVNYAPEGISLDHLLEETPLVLDPEPYLQTQFDMLAAFTDKHNKHLISMPKRRFKVSEWAGNLETLFAAQRGADLSEGTLGKRVDPTESLTLYWDIRSVGSKLRIAKDSLLCISELGIGDGRYQTAVCTTSFESGVVGWELEIQEEHPGDVRIGVCKTKILNNDECFTNFGIGFAVSSDGQTKNGSSIKSNM